PLGDAADRRAGVAGRRSRLEVEVGRRGVCVLRVARCEVVREHRPDGRRTRAQLLGGDVVDDPIPVRVDAVGRFGDPDTRGVVCRVVVDLDEVGEMVDDDALPRQVPGDVVVDQRVGGRLVEVDAAGEVALAVAAAHTVVEVVVVYLGVAQVVVG